MAQLPASFPSAVEAVSSPSRRLLARAASRTNTAEPAELAPLATIAHLDGKNRCQRRNEMGTAMDETHVLRGQKCSSGVGPARDMMPDGKLSLSHSSVYYKARRRELRSRSRPDIAFGTSAGACKAEQSALHLRLSAVGVPSACVAAPQSQRGSEGE